MGVDRLGFEDFYAAEYQRVFSSAYAFCRDREAALDTTQEAFACAFARWRRRDKEEWAARRYAARDLTGPKSRGRSAQGGLELRGMVRWLQWNDAMRSDR